MSKRRIKRELNLTFNEDAESYDKRRLKYCKELFDEIIAYSKIDEYNSVVEVGCGTGQATELILKIGVGRNWITSLRRSLIITAT